ncbi:MAG: metalloprotease [Akkermansiaceae bacterium]
MISFSIFNIPVRVLPWFWITLALIGGALGADSKQALFNILLFLLAGFISILIHELGHALTAKHFGKQVEIVLQAFGGYAAYSGGAPLSRKQAFLITAAGPAIQIVLGMLVFAILKQTQEINPQAAYFLLILAWISIVWAVLNLIPVLPLDGGRLLETVLGPQRRQLTLKISMGVAITTGLLGFAFTNSFLLPIFMGIMAYESYKALQQSSWR